MYMNKSTILLHVVALRTCYVHGTESCLTDELNVLLVKYLVFAGRECNLYTQLYNQILFLDRVIAENHKSLSWCPSMLPVT